MACLASRDYQVHKHSSVYFPGSDDCLVSLNVHVCYCHFVGHCGAFYGLKGIIKRAKMNQ